MSDPFDLAEIRTLPLWPSLTMAWACAALLALTACDVRGADPHSASTHTPLQTPAPRTLESTLRLGHEIDEMQFYPEIATNARGDAVAVWEQFDGERYQIWGNSRLAGREWGLASLLEMNRSGHAYNPQLALNLYGSAMAVWIQADSAANTRTVCSSRFEAATGWGDAMRVDDGDAAGSAYAPHVAIDERGHVSAAWQHAQGSRRTVRVNRHRPDSGWGKASQKRRSRVAPGAAKVNILASGEAQVLWQPGGCEGSQGPVNCAEDGAAGTIVH